MEKFAVVKTLNDLQKRLSDLYQVLDLKAKADALAKLNQELNSAGFWQDQQHSKDVLQQIKKLKETEAQYRFLQAKIADARTLLAMASDLGEDATLVEVEKDISKIEPALLTFERRSLFTHEYDAKSAILEIHPGAGGTEAQDWGEILLRMYRMFFEKKGFAYEVLDYQAGDEAGLKSVTILIDAENAYGYLKSEHGVHRLVRISPFDASKRRHTSFCAVHVTPKIEANLQIEINPEDIRVDTYRSSGAGGQYVNTTDSAIRITHLKTGIVVTCQNERSQLQNKEKAMTILKSKLYRLKMLAQQKKLREISGDTGENSFGSQIRSYIFHPYNLIKDHRTNYETTDVQSVLNGNLDGFIDSYLKSKYNLE